MAQLSLLKDVEYFLQRDLKYEKLSDRVNSKRNALLTKITACIKNTEEQEKIDEFLAQQREVARLASPENDKGKSNIISPNDDSDGDLYMDLTDPDATMLDSGLTLSPPISCGSGSGYESYASDDEGLSRAKAGKEENLDNYFANSGCDIYTYIFLENKPKFLSGKKWLKRVGIISENHLKFYKKPGDNNAILDIPLRAYNTLLSNKDGTSAVIITLSTGDDEGHRFYVEREYVDDWSRVLREKTSSFNHAANLPPPPVVARPPSTLPRSQTTGNGHVLQRKDSMGVGVSAKFDQAAHRAKSMGDISIVITDTSTLFSRPPVPPGHPSQPAAQVSNSNIGKGLKSAMTDMFKKDKTKKRISVAESLGADACGYLQVFEQKWIKKWCVVKGNHLYIYGKDDSPEMNIWLSGCDLRPYLDDPEHSLAFKLMRDKKELVFMEASSSTDMGKWVGVLIAETGCAEMPDEKMESLYVASDDLDHVMVTAKEAFNSRQKQKIAAQDKINEEEEEESLYLDLTAEGQILPQKGNVSKIKPPPLPPTSAKKYAKAPTAARTSSSSSLPVKEPTSKTKEKRRNTDPPIMKTRNENNAMSTIPARSVTLPAVGENLSNGAQKSKNGKKDAKRAELERQKSDLKARMLTLNVTKEELTKYIEASTTEREKGKLRIALQKSSEDYSRLEKEDIQLQLQLTRLNDKTYDIDSPANRRPPSRKEKHPIRTGASGNVMAKAQMWETGGK